LANNGLEKPTDLGTMMNLINCNSKCKNELLKLGNKETEMIFDLRYKGGRRKF
jgi:hypothetical protein